MSGEDREVPREVDHRSGDIAPAVSGAPGPESWLPPGSPRREEIVRGIREEIRRRVEALSEADPVKVVSTSSGAGTRVFLFDGEERYLVRPDRVVLPISGVVARVLPDRGACAGWVRRKADESADWLSAILASDRHVSLMPKEEQKALREAVQSWIREEYRNGVDIRRLVERGRDVLAGVLECDAVEILEGAGVGGKGLVSTAYNLVAQNLEVFREAREKSPGLVPWMIHAGVRGAGIERITSLLRSELPRSGMKFLHSLPVGVLSSLPRRFGFRGSLHLVSRYMDLSRSGFSSGEEGFRLWMALVNRFPLFTGMSPGTWNEYGVHLALSAMRHLWDVGGSLRGGVALLRGEEFMEQARNVFCDLLPELVVRGEGLDGNQRVRRWSGWVEAWREMEEAIALNALREERLGADHAELKWGSFVVVPDRLRANGFRGVVPHDLEIRPLESGSDLIHEGHEMGHCVGGGNYARRCAQQISRVFSLRCSEGRWTLEIRRDGENWHVGQCFGKRNSCPPGWVMSLSKGVAAEYTRLYQSASERLRRRAAAGLEPYPRGDRHAVA